MRLVKIKKITSVGVHRVINLQVEKNHSFITANNIPTHNCDYLSLGAQALLRDFIESVQHIARFIFTCNYIDKVLPELISRCSVIELTSPPADKIYARCLEICKKEGIAVKNKKAVLELVKKAYPDIRKTLVLLKENTINGEINDFTFSNTNAVYQEIFDAMVNRDLEEIRRLLRSKYVVYEELYSFLFENAGEFKMPGEAIIEIGERLYRNSLVPIKEINFMAGVVSMMKNGVI